MRMGIVVKRKKTKSDKKPLFQQASLKAARDPTSSELTVGHITSNLISLLYIPKLTHIATQQSEAYASQLLQYQEALKQNESTVHIQDTNDIQEDEKNAYPNDEEEVTTGALPTDDNVRTGGKKPFPPLKTNLLFFSKELIDEFTTDVLMDTSNHFTTSQEKSNVNVNRWKIGANAAKFERILNEKYGRFRPFITRHPEIEEFIRILQRKISKGDLIPSPFRTGDPPLDKRTSIIILFMMYRQGIRKEIVFLSFLFFIVGLQPWVVVLFFALGQFALLRRRRSRVKGWFSEDDIKSVQPYYSKAVNDILSTQETTTVTSDSKENYDNLVKQAKYQFLSKPVGTILSPTEFLPSSSLKQSTDENQEGNERYDTIIVGTGPATLYTAALLARTGRTVLVLSASDDASGVQVLQSSTYGEVPVDGDAEHIAHLQKILPYLTPALCTSTDTQGGVRFARIGTEADGYTSDILSVPGMGVDGFNMAEPYVLRSGGINAIAEDASAFLADGWMADNGIGNSMSAGYMLACSTINETAGEFYISKLLSKAVNNMKKATTYQEYGIRTSAAFLDKVLPLNAHVRSLMAALGMRAENIPPCKTSLAAHVTNICSFISPDGFSYPVGGTRALCHALATVIEQNGGKIITGVKIKEFLFAESATDNPKHAPRDNKEGRDSDAPRCCGVRLVDNRSISVGASDDCVVISMLDFISTFIFHLPDEIRSRYGVPVGLPNLSERRPLLRFLLCLRGSSEELDITGADWYRLPNAGIARDEIDPVTGEIKQGLIGQESLSDDSEDISPLDDAKETDESIDKSSTDDAAPTSGRGKRVRRNKARKLKFESGRSWMKVSFPSAKDPSWKDRFQNVSTCVVTIEADDDFCQLFETSPRVFSSTKYGQGERDRLFDRVLKDLIDTFPQLKDKVECVQMVGPIRVGLSHNPERYAARGIKPTTRYPGLILGGSDLTVGNSFSASIVAGWMAANATVGYTSIDYLILEKNITTDIAQSLKSPRMPSGVEDIAVPIAEDPKFDDTYNAIEPVAESTKEE